jgi:hypothetical protein
MMMNWFFDPIAFPGAVLSDNNTASGVTRPSLTVLPDALPNGGAVTINLNFSLPGMFQVTSVCVWGERPTVGRVWMRQESIELTRACFDGTQTTITTTEPL